MYSQYLNILNEVNKKKGGLQDGSVTKSTNWSPKTPCWIPSIHAMTHSYLYLQFLEIQYPLLLMNVADTLKKTQMQENMHPLKYYNNNNFKMTCF